MLFPKPLPFKGLEAPLSHFPYRGEALTADGTVRLKPGTIITYCFKVFRYQKLYPPP